MARIDHTIQLLLGGNKGSSLPASEVEKLYEILKADNHADVNIKSEFKRFGINPVTINKVIPQQVSQRLQNVSQAVRQTDALLNQVQPAAQVQTNQLQVPQKVIQRIDADIAKLGLPKTIEYVATSNKYSPEQKLAIINEAITKRGFQPYTDLNDVAPRNLIRSQQTLQSGVDYKSMDSYRKMLDIGLKRQEDRTLEEKAFAQKYIASNSPHLINNATQQQPTKPNVAQQPKPNIAQSVQQPIQPTQQQTNANAEKLKAWRDTPRYNGVTSATAKPFKTISIKSVPVSNVVTATTIGETVGDVAKPSILNKFGNAAKSGVAKKLGAAAVASAATNILPGSDDTIPIPWLESTTKGLETAGELAGGLSLASLGASVIPGVQPVTLPLSSISGIASAGASGLANILRSVYGEKPVKQVVDDVGGVDTNPSKSLHGEDDPAELGYGVPSGDEMSYQDIFDNLAQNKINYETPVSPDVLNKAIKNTVFSSIGEMMGQNTSGGIRGDVVFNNTYNKQLNALLSIRDTLNSADVGSDQYRLAGIASNAMLYGQDVLNSIDSNFNKDIARINSIMKTYSKHTDNSAEIQKYDTELKKTMEKQAAAIAKVEADIAENAEKADNKKIFRYSEQQKQDMLRNAGASYDPVIADYKNRLAQAIARGNAERRIGSSTTMTAKGKAIVDMWNSLPSKDVDITDDHIEYIASKAKLNNVQKKALEATIIAESGGRSSSINESDGDSASVGIIQWNGPRANDLIKSARDQKANPKDAWFQAKYIASDLRNPSSWSSVEAMNRFFATNSQKEANKLLTEKYIMPADSTSRVQILEHYQTKL